MTEFEMIKSAFERVGACMKVREYPAMGDATIELDRFDGEVFFDFENGKLTGISHF